MCPKCGCPNTKYNKESTSAKDGRQLSHNAEKILKEESDLKKRLLDQMKKPTNIPSLRTTNGCGNTLFGSLRLTGMGELEFKAAIYCLFFLPIIPIGVYLVEEVKPDQYRFYGKINIPKFLTILGLSKSVRFIATIIISSAFMILAFVLALYILSLVLEFIHKI